MSIREDLKRIRSTATGFMASRVLLTANNLGVFDSLRRPLTPAQLAQEKGITRRGAEILLDVLVAMGFLRKEGNTYRNTTLADRYLTQGSKYYQGDLLHHYETLWWRWSDLDRVLETGIPSDREFDLASFIRAMDNIARFKVEDVLRSIDLNGVKRVLDLGGGPGTYSVALARKGLEVVLFDRPEVIPLAQEKIRAEGLDGKIQLRGGDFLTDDLGRDYDMVLLSQVLHSYSEEDCLRIIGRTRDALSTGGSLVIHEFYLSADRTSPLQGALFSVNMLVNTPGGRSYSLKEMREFLKKSGFKKTITKRLEDTVVLQARS